jgi:hypothetical protein
MRWIVWLAALWLGGCDAFKSKEAREAQGAGRDPEGRHSGLVFADRIRASVGLGGAGSDHQAQLDRWALEVTLLCQQGERTMTATDHHPGGDWEWFAAPAEGCAEPTSLRVEGLDGRVTEHAIRPHDG